MLIKGKHTPKLILRHPSKRLADLVPCLQKIGCGPNQKNPLETPLETAPRNQAALKRMISRPGLSERPLNFFRRLKNGPVPLGLHLKHSKRRSIFLRTSAFGEYRQFLVVFWWVCPVSSAVLEMLANFARCPCLGKWVREKRSTIKVSKRFRPTIPCLEYSLTTQLGGVQLGGFINHQDNVRVLLCVFRIAHCQQACFDPHDQKPR